MGIYSLYALAKLHPKAPRSHDKMHRATHGSHLGCQAAAESIAHFLKNLLPSSL